MRMNGSMRMTLFVVYDPSHECSRGVYSNEELAQSMCKLRDVFFKREPDETYLHEYDEYVLDAGPEA